MGDDTLSNEASDRDDRVEIADLIAVYQDRDIENRRELAIAKAKLLGLHRELDEARQIIDALTAQLVVDPPEGNRAQRRATEKAAKKAPTRTR